MRRKDGSCFVVDGQQRLAAVKRRGDITKVPCIVFESEGRSSEARDFRLTNLGRCHMNSCTSFKSAVMAKMEPEATISAWLATQGLRVKSNGKSPNGIDFPAWLVRLWKKDAEASKAAILLQRKIIGDLDTLHGAVHRGIWWCLRGGADVSKHVEKIQRCGGKSGILRAIKTIQIETNQGANQTVCGHGVMAVINWRTRSRVKVTQPRVDSLRDE